MPEILVVFKEIDSQSPRGLRDVSRIANDFHAYETLMSQVFEQRDAIGVYRYVEDSELYRKALAGDHQARVQFLEQRSIDGYRGETFLKYAPPLSSDRPPELKPEIVGYLSGTLVLHAVELTEKAFEDLVERTKIAAAGGEPTGGQPPPWEWFLLGPPDTAKRYGHFIKTTQPEWFKTAGLGED